MNNPPGLQRERRHYLLRLPYWDPLRQALREIGGIWDAEERAWIISLDNAEELDEILADYGLARQERVEELEKKIIGLQRQRSQIRELGDPYSSLLRTPPAQLWQPTYRALARVLHPDAGGSDEAMKALNRAYNDACPH